VAAIAGRVRSTGRLTLLGGTAVVAAIPVVVGYGAVAALVVALLLRVIDLHACLLAKKAVAVTCNVKSVTGAFQKPAVPLPWRA
jgi:hypothetical protein